MKKKKKSLAQSHPSLVKEWHPTLNGDHSPADFTFGSEKKVWWHCKKGHDWEAMINNRTSGRGCPYCSGQKVGSDNNLAVLNPGLAKEWHPSRNGDMTAYDVTIRSNKKVWWKCQQGHEWQAIINDRMRGGCPYCSGRRINHENNLAVLNPKLAKEWNHIRNKELSPNNVGPKSSKIVWWKCKNGHEWKDKIQSRAYGTGCPYCSGKKKI
jgi:hypothetical protein